MSAAMRELRSAVMILVEASWEDESGALKTISARMEDRSVSGACMASTEVHGEIHPAQSYAAGSPARRLNLASADLGFTLKE
jgi:hypothetical protein